MLLKYLFRIPFSLIFALLCVSYFHQFISIFWPLQGKISYWFIGGFAAYIPIHVVFRRLIIVHVFSHELTHALWSVLFGGKVDEMYVSRSRGGFTRYSRGNFLVSLAPYFFPLYALVFFGLFFIVRENLKPVFAALCGFSICFHIILTIYSMRIGQPDIRQEGRFFSYPFVALMNLLIIGVIHTGLTGPEMVDDFIVGGAKGSYGLIASVYHRVSPVIETYIGKLFK